MISHHKRYAGMMLKKKTHNSSLKNKSSRTQTTLSHERGQKDHQHSLSCLKQNKLTDQLASFIPRNSLLRSAPLGEAGELPPPPHNAQW